MVVTKVLIVSELFSSLYRTSFSDMNSQCRLSLYYTLSHTAGYRIDHPYLKHTTAYQQLLMLPNQVLCSSSHAAPLNRRPTMAICLTLPGVSLLLTSLAFKT